MLYAVLAASATFPIPRDFDPTHGSLNNGRPHGESNPGIHRDKVTA